MYCRTGAKCRIRPECSLRYCMRSGGGIASISPHSNNTKWFNRSGGKALYWCMLHLGCRLHSSLPQIIGGLLGKPKIRSSDVLNPEPSFQAKRHFWGDGSTTIEHTGQGGTCYAKLSGCFGYGQTQGG